MKKVLVMILLIFPLLVHADGVKLIDEIQRIADDAGGDKDSINLIADTGLAYDNTNDKNLRYVGKNPNNYVLFNGELWRIIGIMNNIENADGNVSARVKIIREESIGKYSWGSSPEEVNNGWGDNEWTYSNVLKVLSNYYNSTKGTCYDINNEEIECDFRENGLSSDAREMVEKVKWNIGAIKVERGYLKLKNYYSNERSSNISRKCNASGCLDTGFEGSVREPTWVGNIGLVYSSDYGYATSGADDNTERNRCINGVNFYSFGTGNNGWLTRGNCYDYDWLHLNYVPGFWTMNPYYNDYFESICVAQSEPLSSLSKAELLVYPVVYLKNNISIFAGDGSKDKPYVLGGFSVIVEGDKDSVKAKNGLSLNNLSEGKEIVLEIFKEGYALGVLKIIDEDGNELDYKKISDKEYKFIMPASNVRVMVQFLSNQEETQKEESVEEKENPETVDKILILIGSLTFVVLVYLFSIINIKKYN